MAVTSAQLTLEEFLKLPEKKPELEYVHGAVNQKVSPKRHHSILQDELLDRFRQYGVRKKIARAFPELRATFSGASVVPDVAVYRWQRIPIQADGRVENDSAHEPPDIAIEIVSPQQSVNGLLRRCLWYVDHGVQIALIVDPQNESVAVFRPNSHPLTLHGSDRIDLSEVLPDFELTVEQLFASLRHD